MLRSRLMHDAAADLPHCPPDHLRQADRLFLFALSWQVVLSAHQDAFFKVGS